MTYFARAHYYFLSWKLELFSFYRNERPGRGARTRIVDKRRGEGDIIRSAVTVVKFADLEFEMVEFIEAAKRNILSFPRSVLVPMRNETGDPKFPRITSRHITACTVNNVRVSVKSSVNVLSPETIRGRGSHVFEDATHRHVIRSALSRIYAANNFLRSVGIMVSFSLEFF